MSRPQSATILVVDDDVYVRTYVRKVLGQSGYSVREAADGVAALEILGWVFLGGLGLVVLSVAYGFDVEYWFEVAAICVDWTVLIAAGALLAVEARRDGDGRSTAVRERTVQ